MPNKAKRKPRPKFDIGDQVFIWVVHVRYNCASFTVTHREYDGTFWFYRNARGPLYAEHLLRIQKRRPDAKP